MVRLEILHLETTPLWVDEPASGTVQANHHSSIKVEKVTK